MDPLMLSKTLVTTRSLYVFGYISPTLALQHDAAGDRATRRPRLLKKRTEKARIKIHEQSANQSIWKNKTKQNNTTKINNQLSTVIAVNRINNDNGDGEEEGSGS
jgi:hypothetical protein